MTSALCPLIYYILFEPVRYILPLGNTQVLKSANTSQTTYDSKNLATHCSDTPDYSNNAAFRGLLYAGKYADERFCESC